MSFLRQCWHVAALSSELTPAGLFPRTLLSEPVVLYRRADGVPVALHDRCPHRFAPLHLATRRDDVLQCVYHGLQFDAGGRCIHNPHGDGVIPKAAVVRSYPVVEHHGLVWIWIGTPAVADPALIPDYAFIDTCHPDGLDEACLHARVHYEVMVDNIMDLSHTDFLHPGLLSTGGALTRTKPTVRDADGRVIVRWDCPASQAMAFFDAFLPVPGAPVDQWLEVQWTPPGLMKLGAGVTTLGAAPAVELTTWNLHLMTPETETSTHYFFRGTRDYALTPEANAQFLQATLHAFGSEDRPVLEAVQTSMGTTDLWSLQPVLLAGDAAQVRARRILADLIAREQAAAG